MSVTKPDELGVIWASNAAPEFVADPGPSKIQTGWLEEAPPVEYFNYMFNKTSAALAHWNAFGVGTFDDETQYYKGSVVRDSTSGLWYRARVDNSGGDVPHQNTDYAPLDYPDMFRGKDLLFFGDGGLSFNYPENTLAAIEGAGLVGMDGVSLDLRLSADGAWVLMRDTTVDRTTNSSGAVSSFSLTTLKAMDAGASFNPYFTGTRIPAVDEAVTKCQEYGLTPLVNIQTSNQSDALNDILINVMKTRTKNYNFVISSGIRDVLDYIRSVDTEIVLAFRGFLSEANIDYVAGLGNCFFITTSAQTESRMAELENKKIPVIVEGLVTTRDTINQGNVSGFMSRRVVNN